MLQQSKEESLESRFSMRDPTAEDFITALHVAARFGYRNGKFKWSNKHHSSSSLIRLDCILSRLRIVISIPNHFL